MAVYIVNIENRDKEDFDGVGLAQVEIAKKLRDLADPDQIRELSLQEILHNPKSLEVVSEEDIVYCNADPYAYIIFYLRHKMGSSFRIMRAVQTGPWNGYLLQEWLCSPLSLEDDLILYISHFAKRLFTDLIPEIRNNGEQIVCYPELLELPRLENLRPLKERPFAALFLGRIAHDKGFQTALEAFEIAFRRDSSLKFCVVGQTHHLDYSEEQFKRIVNEATKFGVEFNTAVPHASVFDYMARSRSLVFPSTSNVESLGRVVLEACHCQTPVLCTAHAETPLIANRENLIDPNYEVGLNRATSMHFPMGKPKAEDLAAMILEENRPIDREVLKGRQKHWDLFADIVLNNSDQSILRGRHTEHLPLPNLKLDGIRELNADQALSKVSTLYDSLAALISFDGCNQDLCRNKF